MRRVVALLLAVGLFAACSSSDKDDAPVAEPPAPPTSAAACPALPAATATTDTSTAAGDFDGDGRPDRLIAGRDGAAGAWRVRVELAAGGGGELPLPGATEGVKAVGGALLDVGPSQAAFVQVGTNAAGVNVGLFVLRQCRLERVTLGGQPADFPVRTSAGARSGLACQVPGLVAYEATSTDGRFYQARTVSYLLLGGIVDEVHRATSMLGADDPALAPYGTFTCGSLKL
jgi:hypothetical protein